MRITMVFNESACQAQYFRLQLSYAWWVSACLRTPAPSHGHQGSFKSVHDWNASVYRLHPWFYVPRGRQQRGSNLGPQSPQADALPTELYPCLKKNKQKKLWLFKCFYTYWWSLWRDGADNGHAGSLPLLAVKGGKSSLLWEECTIRVSFVNL